jgi:transposase-like protein
MPRSDAPPPSCPHCSATHVVRNGSNQSGTAKFLCRGCRRQFVEAPKAGPVPPEKEALVRRLLGERLSLRAIARTAQVSRGWLQGFANRLFRDESRWQAEPPPVPRPKKSGRW